MKEKKYYYYLDVIRLISCIAIFLYHLDILKGGYLAVATFLVLSGYLTCISCFKEEKFSFFKYFKSKFLNIYLPLIVVVFLTILVVPLIKEVNWINLKPETTSVIAGYNNFWQLSANLDYFAHHVNSPFMHFWYLGILLQFELVFPFIFVILKLMGKVHKSIPCVITFIISFLGALYFYYQSKNSEIMNVYYNTFTRLFSIFFGIFLAFVHTYFKKYTISKRIIGKIIFYLYLTLLILAFIFVKSSSSYFALSMILVTLISFRLVSYAVSFKREKVNNFDKIIKRLSSISYEVYLVQYPVIFIVGYTFLKGNNAFIILITVLISFSLNFIMHIKNNKLKYVKIPLLIVLLGFTVFGGYKYVNAKDYTKDMKKLEEDLEKNEKLMEQKREEFLKRQEQEKSDWNITLEDLKKGEDEIKEYVHNLNIIGVGDSVMLGALSGLYDTFPNGYFDAKTSRTDYEAAGVLNWLKDNNMLGNPIVLGLGTNGQCGSSCRDQVLNIAGDREIFMLTVTNDYEVFVNDDLINYANNHNNVHIIDWNNLSKGHPEYFIADGIHLTPDGIKAYADVLYDSLFEFYITDYNKKVDEILKQHEEELKNKITFYGNELLLNQDIMDYYSGIKFDVNKDYTYESLVKKLNDEKENDTLTHNLVFAFDNTCSLSLEQYEKVIELLKNYEIYIVTFDIDYSFENENVHIINFKNELDNYDDYIMVDKVHLTKKGNDALFEIIKNNIKKESN